MADIPLWTGTEVFVSQSSPTPFAFYDSELAFQQDADKVAKFCAVRLGYPMLDVELGATSFYTCFEQAVTVYGNEVFQYSVRENYINLQGSPLSTDLNNTLIRPTLTRAIEISKNYGTEAEVGSLITKYKGVLQVTGSVQTYDLNAWADDNAITGGIEIRKVFNEAPPAILRYFDPYAGTGTGMQSLMDSFDFGSYSPGMNFLLMPASFDLLKVQAIEFNDQIRRSAYSFELNNNQLTIFPRPKVDSLLWFEYYKVSEKQGVVDGVSGTDGVVINVSEVPYSNPVYGEINSIGKVWIKEYTLALTKEILAYVRGKYGTVPIPGGETTLNQADLLADARTEKEALLLNLREMLEQTSREKQLERQANEGTSLNNTLKGVPMLIYIG